MPFLASSSRSAESSSPRTRSSPSTPGSGVPCALAGTSPMSRTRSIASNLRWGLLTPQAADGNYEPSAGKHHSRLSPACPSPTTNQRPRPGHTEIPTFPSVASGVSTSSAHPSVQLVHVRHQNLKASREPLGRHLARTGYTTRTNLPWTNTSACYSSRATWTFHPSIVLKYSALFRTVPAREIGIRRRTLLSPIGERTNLVSNEPEYVRIDSYIDNGGAPVVSTGYPTGAVDPRATDVRYVQAVARTPLVTRTDSSRSFAPDAVVAAIAGVALLVVGSIAMTRAGFKGPLDVPVLKVLGFTHTAILGIVEAVIGACLLIAGAARSKGATMFFGTVLRSGRSLVRYRRSRSSKRWHSRRIWRGCCASSVSLWSSPRCSSHGCGPARRLSSPADVFG